MKYFRMLLGLALLHSFGIGLRIGNFLAYPVRAAIFLFHYLRLAVCGKLASEAEIQQIEQMHVDIKSACLSAQLKLNKHRLDNGREPLSISEARELGAQAGTECFLALGISEAEFHRRKWSAGYWRYIAMLEKAIPTVEEMEEYIAELRAHQG